MRPERGAISQMVLGVLELSSFQKPLFVCVSHDTRGLAPGTGQQFLFAVVRVSKHSL
jgi:hypothetical protein